MKWFALLALALPLFGTEYAILRNGTVFHADRVERLSDRLILHRDGGRIELAHGDVESIETVAPPPIVIAPAATEALTPPPTRIATPRELVTEAAERNGLPPELVRSVASAESAFRTNALSRKGAIGVMQLMPDTARKLDVDPNVVEQNIDGGARLLRELLLKYQDHPSPVRRALAAYNAGEAAVDKYNGVPPYRETQLYVERVLQKYWKEMKGR